MPRPVQPPVPSSLAFCPPANRAVPLPPGLFVAISRDAQSPRLTASPKSSEVAPTRKPGRSPAWSSIHTASEEVVVLPWVPQDLKPEGLANNSQNACDFREADARRAISGRFAVFWTPGSENQSLKKRRTRLAAAIRPGSGRVCSRKLGPGRWKGCGGAYGARESSATAGLTCSRGRVEAWPQLRELSRDPVPGSTEFGHAPAMRSSIGPYLDRSVLYSGHDHGPDTVR